MKNSEKQWLQDFKEFSDTDEMTVPPEVSHSILSHVKKELNPPVHRIFSKLIIFHIPIGFLSLLICNQFNMGPFQTGFSLAKYFMYFGNSTCMFLCGLFFVSTSILISSLILRPEELSMLKKNSSLHALLLSSLSIGCFLIFGAEMTLTIGILWILGATLGGIASSHLIFYVRNIDLH